MSNLEESLAWQMKAAGLPEPERQYRFLPNRKYRADFAFVGQRILVECQGGQWVQGGGAHQRPNRWQYDCRRMNQAQRAGWMVLQYTGDMIRSGEALVDIEEIIGKIERERNGAA